MVSRSRPTLGLERGILTARPEIFSAGVDFSVAQTTGTAIGEGGSDTCPKGNWECALKVTPYLVQIDGLGTPYGCEGVSGDSEPYTIQSPHTDQSGSKYNVLRDYVRPLTLFSLDAIVSIELCSCPDFDGSTGKSTKSVFSKRTLLIHITDEGAPAVCPGNCK